MITRLPVVAAALLAFAPITASAQDAPATRSAYVQGTLNIIAGERVTLRRQADGSFAMEKAERIDFAAVMPPSDGTQAGPRGLVNTAPGTISFALHAQRGVGSLLRIENGTEDGLKYVAYVRRVSGGQITEPARTSTCTVPAGLASFEHWQEPVIQVVAASFTDVDDAAPVCESHDVNE